MSEVLSVQDAREIIAMAIAWHFDESDSPHDAADAVLEALRERDIVLLSKARRCGACGWVLDEHDPKCVPLDGAP